MCQIAKYRRQVKQTEPYTGPVRVEAYFVQPDRRRRDLDNFLKLAQDALMKGGAIEDDSQVVELHAFKFVDTWTKKTAGRTRLIVTPADQPPVTQPLGEWWRSQ